MISSLAYAITFPWDYRRGLHAVRRSDAEENATPEVAGQYVLLDLKTEQILTDMGRHLYTLIDCFRQAGVRVRLRKNRRFLARAGRKRYGRSALSLENIEAEWETAPSGTIVGTLCDRESSSTPLMFGNASSDNAVVFPYPMHPLTYATIGPSTGLEKVRGKRVTFEQPRVFFSGNIGDKYDRSTLQRQHGVVSRARMLAALQQEFAAEASPQLDDYEDLKALLESPKSPRLVINHSKICPIPSRQWLDTVAQFDFFLCCPGISHPLCHNAIEAMAVGTIPIIEFPKLFSPPLRDRVNAITFQGLSNLPEAVERALGLSVTERAQMRSNVIQYYDKHLCIRRFGERWMGQGAASPIQFPYLEAA